MAKKNFKSVDIPSLIKKSEKELADMGLTDKDIFLSNQFRTYCQHIVDSMLGSANVQVPYVYVVDKPEFTGRTDNTYITISATSSLVTKWSTKEARFAALLGLLFHEISHCVYGEWTTTARMLSAVRRGQFPVPFPSNAPQEFIDDFRGKYQPVFAELVTYIDNLMEDRHDEEKLKADAGEFVTTSLNKLLAGLHLGCRPLEEVAKQNMGMTVGTLTNAIFQLCRFDEVLVLREESISVLQPYIEAFRPLIKQGVETDQMVVRFDAIIKISLLLWEFMKNPPAPPAGAGDSGKQDFENPTDYLRQRPSFQQSTDGTQSEGVNEMDDIDQLLAAINTSANEMSSPPQPTGRQNSSKVPQQSQKLPQNGGSANQSGQPQSGGQQGGGQQSGSSGTQGGQSGGSGNSSGTGNSSGAQENQSNSGGSNSGNGQSPEKQGSQSGNAGDNSSSGGQSSEGDGTQSGPSGSNGDHGEPAGGENQSGEKNTGNGASENGDSRPDSEGNQGTEGNGQESSEKGNPSNTEGSKDSAGGMEGSDESENGDESGKGSKSGAKSSETEGGSETGDSGAESEDGTTKDGSKSSKEGDEKGSEDGNSSANDEEHTSVDDYLNNLSKNHGWTGDGDESESSEDGASGSGKSGSESSEAENAESEKAAGSNAEGEKDASSKAEDGTAGDAEGESEDAESKPSQTGKSGESGSEEEKGSDGQSGGESSDGLANKGKGDDAPPSEPMKSITKQDLENFINSMPDDVRSQFESILKQVIHEKAVENIEQTVRDDLLSEIKGVNMNSSHANKKVDAVSYEPSSSAEDTYNGLYSEVGPYSKLLQRKITDALRDMMEGGISHHRQFGRMIEPNNAYRPDQRFYANKKQPENLPEMAISVLVDMSGSMNGPRMEAAKRAAIMLQDFCAGLSIPCMVAGHNTAATRGDIKYVVFSDFHNITKANRLSLAEMRPGGCNRDGMAIEISSALLAKRPERIKMLFVISDGQPNDGNYGGSEAAKDIQSIIKRYQKKDIETFAVAIGDDKDKIHAIYGDGFIDITDLQKMPKLMTNVVKKRLMRELR